MVCWSFHAFTGSNVPVATTDWWVWQGQMLHAQYHPFSQLMIDCTRCCCDNSIMYYFGTCILLNNKLSLLGVSPKSYNGLSPGDHRLRVVPEGCLSIQGQTYRFTVWSMKYAHNLHGFLDTCGSLVWWFNIDIDSTQRCWSRSRISVGYLNTLLWTVTVISKYSSYNGIKLHIIKGQIIMIDIECVPQD